MKKNEILLSTGSIPWHCLENAARYAEETGYDGLEIVPSRSIVREIKILNLNFIKSIHQTWRLDIGLDKSYGIKFPVSIFFTLLRLVLFPKINESNKALKLLSDNLHLPITVHNLSDNWTRDNDSNEFSGGILYEIIGKSITPSELKVWMQKENHNIVVDSRDDQSLMWAKKHGINTWQIFWEWLGINKIHCYQLTLIGIHGLRKIIKHEKSLAEEQLLWLYTKNWRGKVTAEINPLIIFWLFKGNMKKGFELINQFIKHTLIEGKKWSF